jgi:hypothetical protein
VNVTDFQPRLGIVLGSGLGGIADALTGATRFPYTELQGFPQPTVAGHGGTLHMGDLNGLPVAVFAGRTKVLEAAVISSGEEICVPCGGCRQRLREFMPLDGHVHLCSATERRTVTLEELLPMSFGPEFLPG